VTRIIDSGIPTEIYTVVNDRSVDTLEEFAAWLADFAHAPTFFPFPVRGPDTDRFAIRAEQVPLIERLACRHDDFAAVLPPRAYLERLIRFYADGERRFRCHLPRLVVSTFSDGVITPCPNIWFSDIGNLTGPDPARSLARVGNTGLYKALLADRPRLTPCKGCFTPWDLLSMYLDDEISLDELCASPTYAAPAIRAILEEKKRAYDGVRR
jgi:hypothetical protein